MTLPDLAPLDRLASGAVRYYPLRFRSAGHRALGSPARLRDGKSPSNWRSRAPNGHSRRTSASGGYAPVPPHTGHSSLTELLRCGSCGGRMCGKTRRKGGKRYRYYVCNGGMRRADGRCRTAGLVAGQIENAVEAVLLVAHVGRTGPDRHVDKAGAGHLSPPVSRCTAEPFRRAWSRGAQSFPRSDLPP